MSEEDFRTLCILFVLICVVVLMFLFSFYELCVVPCCERRLSDDVQIVLETYNGGGGGCVICQEEYKDGEDKAALIACNHKFHTVCVATWLMNNDTCPLCRTYVV
ncbi:hypothetical protein CDL12_02912 [Handroanthus impetiginosus]|uniref:RING-type E3 ubiquitin transferase n=1 Tax=Handroanthus impetiginosus TaxID=429701 RepID=A0A2G9I3Q7_9LAMI|nr:hypothetical protein CDL12_02912 [Handroanthus impetiginosus]